MIAFQKLNFTKYRDIIKEPVNEETDLGQHPKYF